MLVCGGLTFKYYTWTIWGMPLEKQKDGHDTFHRFVSIKAGDGHSIKFLHDSRGGTFLYRRIS